MHSYVEQGINIGLEKFVEKNKNRPLNKPRKHENHPQPMEKTPKFNKHRAFHKAVEPGKNTKLISIGPKFIPNYTYLCLR